MAERFRLTAIRIAGKDDGTYSPDPHGRLAVLIPVRDRWGEIADIIAFIQDEPEQWWRRYGDETPILGAQALAQAIFERQPLVPSGRRPCSGSCNAAEVPSCWIGGSICGRFSRTSRR